MTLLVRPLILRSGACAASRRMKARIPASWFETALTRLLTMRIVYLSII
jgi:hypothetical protein